MNSLLAKEKIRQFLKDNEMGGVLVYAKQDFRVYRMFPLNVETDEDSYGVFYNDDLVVECDTKELAINVISDLIYKEMN